MWSEVLSVSLLLNEQDSYFQVLKVTPQRNILPFTMLAKFLIKLSV